MTDRTREEHVAWCKERALAYLPGKPTEAVTSMMSDMDKHPECSGLSELALGLMMIGKLNTAHEAREFIEGYR